MEPRPVSRRAICGAASATKTMGPAAAVTAAVAATPRTTSSSFVRSTGTPSIAAVSSASSSQRIRRCATGATRATAATRAEDISTAGQPMALSEPAPQTAARSAVSTSAFTENQVLTEESSAPTAMPTMMSRKPRTPVGTPADTRRTR